MLEIVTDDRAINLCAPTPELEYGVGQPLAPGLLKRISGAA